MELHGSRNQNRRLRCEKLEMRNDLRNNECVMRERRGSAFQKWSRIAGAVGLATRMR
jgi:hypothetical protein